MHYFSKTKRQGGCLKIRQGYYVYANDNEQYFGRFRCKAKTTEAEVSGGANFEDGSRHRLQTGTVHSCVQYKCTETTDKECRYDLQFFGKTTFKKGRCNSAR